MHRRLRQFRYTLLSAMLCLVVAPLSAAQDAVCTQVRVAGPESYPPFVWYNEPGPEVDGVGVSFVRRALEGMDIKVTSVKTSSWNRSLARGAAGEIDVLTALYKTDERSETMHFIGPYGEERTAVVSRAALGLNVSDLSQLGDLYGGAAQGDSRGDFVEGELKNLNVIRAPHVRLLFAMLKAERLDYILVGEFSGLVRRDFNILEDPALKVDVLDEPTEGVYLAISRRSPCFETIRGHLEKRVILAKTSGRLEEMKREALARFRAGQEPAPPASKP